MPSRAERLQAGGSSSTIMERWRAGGEWLLRVALIALLAWALARAIALRSHGGTDAAATGTLGASLQRWSTARTPERVRLALDRPPAVRERDWLAALEGAGTAVEWHGDSLVPTAISVDPRVDPVPAAEIAVAAPPRATVVLRDTAGAIDSATATEGVHAIVSRPRATLEAAVGPTLARGAARDSLVLHRLLVLGDAQWETKFVVAALEERGWQVDAHFALSPKGDVAQGLVGATIDTGRYSAVLAIDSAAAPYADRIATFVRTGGGLVLWSPAAKLGALAALAPGAPGDAVPDDEAAPSDTAPRRVLALAPIVALARDAVVLERRPEGVALAARRVGVGRVIETGYLDSWRWRMAGGEDAPAAHREWIAGLVAAVAHAGRRAVVAPPTDAAPLATLIDRVGPPTAPGAATPATTTPLPAWLFAVLCAAAIVEWASRRLRGVK